jgi:serine/threonine-protein phosphatase 2B catalytic subunit
VIDGQHKRINHDYLKDHFFREGRLKEQQALYILEQVTNVLSREPNMVNVKSPVTSVLIPLPPLSYLFFV